MKRHFSIHVNLCNINIFIITTKSCKFGLECDSMSQQSYLFGIFSFGLELIFGRAEAMKMKLSSVFIATFPPTTENLPDFLVYHLLVPIIQILLKCG